MNARTQSALGLMLLVTLWFGFQAWFVQSAVYASSALAFNAERFITASVLLTGICIFARVRVSKRAVTGGVLIGLIFTAAIAAETQALALGSPGRAGFLGSIYVAFLPFIALKFRAETLHPSAIIGSIIVLAGGGVLLYTPDGNFMSDIYAVLRAIAFSGYLLLLRTYAHEDWRVMGLVSALVVSMLSIILAVVTDQAHFSLSVGVLAPVTAAALVGTIACVALTSWSGRYLNALLMGIVSFFESPFTVVWGIVFGRELLSTTSLAAFVIITVGAVLALSNRLFSLPKFHVRIRAASRTAS